MMRVRIIDLPKILDRRGNLSFLEGLNHIPFKIERTHWVYDVPGGQSRGGHAYKVTREFIVALSGSFDVVVNNGQGEERFHMNRSYYGLYLPAGTWRMMDNFSTNSLALVVSSTKYDAEDYIRDFEQFKRLKQDGVQTDSI